MISHDHKCVFIHIPKTAGTSMEKKLGLFEEVSRGVQDHTPIMDVEPLSVIDLSRILLKGRVKYALKDVRNTFKGNSPRLSRAQYNSYFKFAFVRNSWSRVYSWYQNVMRDEEHQRNSGLSGQVEFPEFVRNHLTSRLIRSQMSWLTDNKGKVPLDFIGRFENLREDFSHVCDKLELSDSDLPKLISGSHKNSYVDVYDDETRKIVAERFSDEISYFKFEFGE